MDLKHDMSTLRNSKNNNKTYHNASKLSSPILAATFTKLDPIYIREPPRMQLNGLE